MPVKVVTIFDKIIKAVRLANRESVDTFTTLLSLDLRGVVPVNLVQYIQTEKASIRGDTVRGKIVFTGDQQKVQDFINWHEGSATQSREIVHLTPEEAEAMANKLVAGGKSRDSEEVRKLMEEHRVIRKLPEPIQGKPGTKWLLRAPQDRARKRLVPIVVKDIVKSLSRLGGKK